MSVTVTCPMDGDEVGPSFAVTVAYAIASGSAAITVTASGATPTTGYTDSQTGTGSYTTGTFNFTSPPGTSTANATEPSVNSSSTTFDVTASGGQPIIINPPPIPTPPVGPVATLARAGTSVSYNCKFVSGTYDCSVATSVWVYCVVYQTIPPKPPKPVAIVSPTLIGGTTWQANVPVPTTGVNTLRVFLIDNSSGMVISSTSQPL